MPTFTYKAKDRAGSTVEGTMDGENRGAVISRLQSTGYFPIKVEAGKGGTAKALAATAGNIQPKVTKTVTPLPTNGKGTAARETKTVARPGAPAASNRSTKADAGTSAPAPPKMSRRKISTSDLAAFNRQMADLLGAGVALVKALNILNKQTNNQQLQQVLSDINTDVSGGATFADALGRHPTLFSKLYVAMVRSGEAGGMLDEVLKRLADYSEQEEQLRGKIKAALAYPVVMSAAGSVAIAVMFGYVVPKIVGTFKELNQTLPPLTLALIKVSEFVQAYWYFVVGGLVVGGIALWKFLQTEEGRATWHRLQLRIPIFNDLVRKREVARFSRTLGSLLKNGVPILTALTITRDVLDNTVVKREVDTIMEEITQGAGIAAPLKNSQIFPPVVVNMMAVGEETGQLEAVLLRISESFELEVDRRVRTMTSLIEPLIIVIMGCVVAVIVIAMMLPIFSMDPSASAG